jgi:hypothetical protein
MTHRAPPLSNAERQRLFRQRHPGYFNNYRSRQKAIADAARAGHLAQCQAQFAAQLAAEAEAQASASREPLMLPAPAEAIVLPGLNKTAEMVEAQPAAPASTSPAPMKLPFTLPYLASRAA